MNRYAFIPVIALVTLAGCTSKPGYILSYPALNEQDRALLNDTHVAAEEAKAAAAQSAEDTKAAREATQKAQADADKAAAAATAADADATKADTDAQAVSTKIDRMVGGQGK